MSGKRHGFTLGTIFTICLTATVAVGCIWLFSRIQGGNPGAQMNAQRVMGLVGEALQGATALPETPQTTVRTVTVTLAPTAAPTQAPPAQQTAAPQVRQSYSFTLTAGGLMAFHSDISDSVYDANDKTLDYRPVVSQLSAKVNADLNLVTLPQCINAADLKYADALAPAAAADAIRAAGFDDALLSTEHALDQGAQGAADTVSALTARGLTCGGVNAGSTHQNRMIQLNGARIAILAYTDSLTAKSKNALSGQPGLMTVFELSRAAQEIRAARNQGADCVIVCLYWGKAETAGVTNAMRNTAASLAQAGADVILGTHPSRVLPIEILSVILEDGTAHDCLAVYSLGTLLTESREGYDISGILLHLSLRCDGQGKVHFEAVQYTPTYIWRQNVNGKMQYRVVCSADPAPEGMSEQQKEVMQRALNRIKNTLKDSPVTQK